MPSRCAVGCPSQVIKADPDNRLVHPWGVDGRHSLWTMFPPIPNAESTEVSEIPHPQPPEPVYHLAEDSTGQVGLGEAACPRACRAVAVQAEDAATSASQQQAGEVHMQHTAHRHGGCWGGSRTELSARTGLVKVKAHQFCCLPLTL